ncbi:unnamed protein product [Symbiodinium natans]|uniref:Uncharacterized protein n=1 Tax=Symbiodinium natans TaxID=878477 RepID=A0A812SLU0_9DINO|nr:unnamed protein product [Symbiodinium natans]
MFTMPCRFQMSLQRHAFKGAGAIGGAIEQSLSKAGKQHMSCGEMFTMPCRFQISECALQRPAFKGRARAIGGGGQSRGEDGNRCEGKGPSGQAAQIHHTIRQGRQTASA